MSFVATFGSYFAKLKLNNDRLAINLPGGKAVENMLVEDILE